MSFHSLRHWTVPSLSADLRAQLKPRVNQWALVSFPWEESNTINVREGAQSQVHLHGQPCRPASSLLRPRCTKEASNSHLTTMTIVSLVLLPESDETGQATTMRVRFISRPSQANQQSLFYFSTDISSSSK